MAKGKAKPKSKYAAKVAETKPKATKPKAKVVAKVYEVPKAKPKPAEKTEQVHEPVPEPYVTETKVEAPATWQCVWCGLVQSVDAKNCGRCMQAR